VERQEKEATLSGESEMRTEQLTKNQADSALRRANRSGSRPPQVHTIVTAAGERRTSECKHGYVIENNALALSEFAHRHCPGVTTSVLVRGESDQAEA